MTSCEPQSTGAVLMVRPACFRFNPQTAASNAFQRAPDPDCAARDEALVLAEFDAVVRALRRAGVEVVVAADTPLPEKPDAIFPNNWVSFHRDGTIGLYPLCAPNRRAERREEVIDQVVREGGFRVARTVDLSYREAEARYLEGTGSLVLDRVAHIAYAGLSPRTDLEVLGEFAQRLDYELVTFEAEDETSRPVYHTNVVMAVGERFAVVCGEALTAPLSRAAVFAKLTASGHEIVDISLRQMHAFAGNCLELTAEGRKSIVLSATAWGALDPSQRSALARHGGILRVEIPTIERVGGGGVRCMLAEIHLPKRG